MSEAHARRLQYLRERTVGDTTVMELLGDIDILTAPLVSVRIDALTAGPRPDLVLDLRRVSFIDCSGLRLLCRARNRIRTQHGRLRLVTGSPRFLRILRHAGLAGVFEVHTHLPEALAHEVEPSAVSAQAG
ncbi:STAS domain-containing protein [Streptomyces sp. NBC_00444]|uniref:STAS domain-containing protein n=1 Tax=Streptomyces sp. NBC_00444 TaxID=2975744 RepID=UPI002E1C7011